MVAWSRFFSGAAKPSAVFNYGVAVFSVAAALGIAAWLQYYVVSTPVSLSNCAIMFSAWIGVAKPGLFAIVLSTFAFKYCFVSPLYSLAVEKEQIPRLLAFMLASLFIGLLGVAYACARDDSEKYD